MKTEAQNVVQYSTCWTKGQHCTYVRSLHIAECIDQPGKVANPARGQLNRENEYSPVPVRALGFGLTRRGQPSRLASACSFSILRLNCDPTYRERFDMFPPDWGMLRKSRGAFRFFFKST